MTYHRINKYSRHVVSQDCVLSCHANTIQEIPFLNRGKVSSLSLRDQNQNAGTGRLSWLEKDLDLSGMLMCWHLLKSRSMPRATARKKGAEIQRRKTVEKHERGVNSLLTLRNQTLHMAIEKYLLFLMPREVRKQRAIEIVASHFLSRRDRFHLSILYVHTALGLCQYRAGSVPLRSMASNQKKNVISSSSVKDSPTILREATTPVLAIERISFPFMDSPQHVSLQNLAFRNELTPTIDSTFSWGERTPSCCSPGQSVYGKQKLPQSENMGLRVYRQSRSQVFSHQTLSLCCPSLLTSPDIQDVAQSGRLTLDGSLTLELF